MDVRTFDGGTAICAFGSAKPILCLANKIAHWFFLFCRIQSNGRIVTFDLISLSLPFVRSFGWQMCQKLFCCKLSPSLFFSFDRDCFFVCAISSTKWCLDACLLFDSTDDSKRDCVQCTIALETERQQSPWLGAIGLGFIYEPTTFYIFYILFHCRLFGCSCCRIVGCCTSIGINQSTATPDHLPNERFPTHATSAASIYNMHHLFICIYNLLMFPFYIWLVMLLLPLWILLLVKLCSDWSEFNEQNMNYALSI